MVTDNNVVIAAERWGQKRVWGINNNGKNTTNSHFPAKKNPATLTYNTKKFLIAPWNKELSYRSKM